MNPTNKIHNQCDNHNIFWALPTYNHSGISAQIASLIQVLDQNRIHVASILSEDASADVNNIFIKYIGWNEVAFHFNRISMELSTTSKLRCPNESLRWLTVTLSGSNYSSVAWKRTVRPRHHMYA